MSGSKRPPRRIVPGRAGSRPPAGVVLARPLADPGTRPTARRGRAPSPEDLREASEIDDSGAGAGADAGEPGRRPRAGTRADGATIPERPDRPRPRPGPGANHLLAPGPRAGRLPGRPRLPGRDRSGGSSPRRSRRSSTTGPWRASTTAIIGTRCGSSTSSSHRSPPESDPRTSKARVLRALADVRQYTATTGASWSNALMAARKMVDTVGKEPAYRDVSTELAELVIKTGEALADRAGSRRRRRSWPRPSRRSRCTRRVAGKAAGPMLARSRLPAKLAEARAAVLKRQARERGLAAMDAALKAGSSSGVYDARDVLVASYPDLAGDRDLISRMTRANDLIRERSRSTRRGDPPRPSRSASRWGRRPASCSAPPTPASRRPPPPRARASTRSPTGSPTGSTRPPAHRSGRSPSASRPPSLRWPSPAASPPRWSSTPGTTSSSAWTPGPAPCSGARPSESRSPTRPWCSATRSSRRRSGGSCS